MTLSLVEYHPSIARNVQITLLGILVGSKESNNAVGMSISL